MTDPSDHYRDKGADYFSSTRTEILPLLGGGYGQVLEVGCGSGATLGWLKRMGLCRESTGIEVVGEAAAEARRTVDHVIAEPVETAVRLLPQSSFDLILCLDVLEHLYDPWMVLADLVEKLKPQGEVIVSLPNVRYVSVIMDLVIRGRFDYQSKGILDRTHVRFFTHSNARSLLISAGLSDVAVFPHPSRIAGKAAVANLLTFGRFRDAFSWQILGKGVRR